MALHKEYYLLQPLLAIKKLFIQLQGLQIYEYTYEKRQQAETNILPEIRKE